MNKHFLGGLLLLLALTTAVLTFALPGRWSANSAMFAAIAIAVVANLHTRSAPP